MADLLECLLQIKALRETAERLTALVGRVEPGRWNQPAPGGAPSAAALVARLAEAEGLHGTWLRTLLTAEQPLLPLARRTVVADAGDARASFDRFIGYRVENLALLDRCSARDLSRCGVHETRRQMSVADLVALMLANDTDTVCRIREALGVA